MSRNIFITGIFYIFFYCLGLPTTFAAQNNYQLLRKFGTEKWPEKNGIITNIKLSRDTLSQVEVLDLIQIFEQESEWLKKNNYTPLLKRSYSNYYCGFSSLVQSFDNEKTVKALLYALHGCAPDPINPGSIINLGEKILDPLIALTDDNDSGIKESALQVLALWVNGIQAEDYQVSKKLSADKETYQKIKEIFLSNLADKESGVRTMSIFGLEAFSDENVINKLQIVASMDPYSFESKFTKKTIYPVREDALRTIQILKERMKLKTLD